MIMGLFVIPLKLAEDRYGVWWTTDSLRLRTCATRAGTITVPRAKPKESTTFLSENILKQNKNWTG